MTDNTAIAAERPELLIACGILGLLGMAAPLLTITVGTLVTDHDFIAQTISDLGKGEKKNIMDAGFYANAAGLIALSIAAAHAHLGKTGWSLGVFCLAFLALVVTMLGLWDDFHTQGDNPPGMTIHTKLTFALFPLYLAGPLLMARAAGRVWRGYPPVFVAVAAVWAVFAIAFKLAPTGYDGILEKIAIGATMIWTTSLSLMFLRRGLRARTDTARRAAPETA